MITLADVQADIQCKKDQEYKARIAVWLKENPQVGTLNSGKFYVSPAGGDYKEIEAFSVVKPMVYQVINSNLVAENGLQITEGAKVHRTDQDDSTNNGEFRVIRADKVDMRGIPIIELAQLDGSRPLSRYATPEELRVLVR